jgi:hypothetical protein
MKRKSRVEKNSMFLKWFLKRLLETWIGPFSRLFSPFLAIFGEIRKTIFP